MNRNLTILIITLGVFGCFSDALAQYRSEKDATIPLEHFYIERQRSALRLLLSKLHFGLSTGYGRSALMHDLEGFGIAQPPNGAPLLFNSNDVTIRYSNWVNAVVPSTDPLPPGTVFINSNTTDLGFRAKNFHIPLKATVHVEVDRFRIGGGYAYEYSHIGTFNPTSHADQISSFAAPVDNFFMKKYFVLLGGSVYRYYEYLLVVDANIGGYKLGRAFNQSQIQRGLYFNFGATIERDMSEYFKVFVRPSYEFKKFDIGVAEGGLGVRHRFNSFYLNFGVAYRLPELRRCFMKECHAQINHAHGNREYRSRRHPIYKKQNPHYGENYPTLIKYKGRNKRKLSPY